MKQIIAAAALAIGFASPAMALSVFETTDFANSLSSVTSIGTFDAGFNDVSGEMNGSCTSSGLNCFGGPDRQDGFTFTIAAGQQLTSIFVGSEGFGPTGFTWNAQIRETSFSVLETLIRPINDSGTMTAFAPLGEGTYLFNINSFETAAAGGFTVFWFADFEVETILPPVPLPAGAPLLAAGLMLIAGLRRRRNR